MFYVLLSSNPWKSFYLFSPINPAFITKQIVLYQKTLVSVCEKIKTLLSLIPLILGGQGYSWPVFCPGISNPSLCYAVYVTSHSHTIYLLFSVWEHHITRVRLSQNRNRFQKPPVLFMRTTNHNQLCQTFRTIHDSGFNRFQLPRMHCRHM